MAIDTASNQIVETETLGRPLDAVAAEDGLVCATVG
jgi:hypothetical protein